MGTVPRRPAPSYLDEPAAPAVSVGPVPTVLRAWTRNPGAAAGFLVAWLVTLGRYGRLPLYASWGGNERPTSSTGPR